MADSLEKQIRENLNAKETEDLLQIWQTEHPEDWDDRALELVRQILLERLGQVPPQSLTTQIRLALKEAESRRQAGDLEKAREACERILQMIPGHAPAHSGQIHQQSGREDEAPANDEKAARLDPGLKAAAAEIHYTRGLIHHEAGRVPEALADYQAALQLDPDSDARYGLEELEAGLEVEFQHSPAKQHLDQALAYAQDAEPASALQECELARESLPDIALAYNYLGLILEGLEQLEPAVAAYLQAIRLNPRFYAARENLANASLKLEAEAYRQSAPDGWEAVLKKAASRPVEDSELPEYASPVPGWVYMDQKALLLPGWPGYRNRPGRLGLDPLDRNCESGHLQGVLLRPMLTLKFRTHNPVYLLMMSCMGLLYSSPLLAIGTELYQGPWWLVIPSYSLYAAPGLLLLGNVFSSLTTEKPQREKDNGSAFF